MSNNFSNRCHAAREMLYALERSGYASPYIEDAFIILDNLNPDVYPAFADNFRGHASQIEEAMFVGFKKHRDDLKSYQDFVKLYMPPLTSTEIMERYGLDFCTEDSRAALAKYVVHHFLDSLFSLISFSIRKE